MVEAHVSSVMTLGSPFSHNAPDLYDFGAQQVTEQVQNNISVMLKYRLTPPPDESYSLHRKLSGIFLLATKLRARVPCKRLFKDVVDQMEPRE
jgi:aarF domain-containing kinase